jgi:prepilin-type N-terminal cleavage/methylation domain-containing protein
MRKSKGFTLVELMIVIAVIAILATMGLVGFRRAQQSGRDTARNQLMKGIQVGLECAYGRDGAYPATGDFDWGALSTSLGSDCFAQATITDPWKSTTVPAGNPATLTDISVTYQYTSATPNTSYTLVMVGETGRSYTFESPK